MKRRNKARLCGIFLMPVKIRIQSLAFNQIDMPALTQYVLSASLWCKDNWYTWGAGVFVFMMLFGAYKKTPMGRKQVDWMMLNVPVFGPLFRKVGLSRFSRTFATLIKSGVPILGSLEIVSANFPQIRLLTIPYGQGPEPRAGFPRLHEWSGWFSRHFRKGDWGV